MHTRANSPSMKMESWWPPFLTFRSPSPADATGLRHWQWRKTPSQRRWQDMSTKKRDIPIRLESSSMVMQLVAVPTVVAAKLALFSAMRAQRITKVELAGRLGISESAVRKLANPDHRSHISQVQKALRAVGRSLVVEVIAA